MFDLLITPSGHLRCQPLTGEPGGGDNAALSAIADAFAKDGAGAGLFRLAALKTGEGLPLACAFWRDFALRFLNELCHTPESAGVIPPVEPPAPADMVRVLLSIPPMTGAEYLTITALDNAWRALDQWVHETATACGGLSGFLQQYAPHWKQVGRVCFHLAENKDDEEFPFAFLATYASGLTKSGKPRYVPLSQALLEYSGARNKAALVRLLTPVSAAGEKSAFVASLVESGDIYHPYPLEADEAYRFLTEVPVYEGAGVLVRLPDWWHARPRVQALVKVGNESHNKLTANALLDFKIEAAIGEQSLSAKELQELLAGGSGLRFVKGQWVEVDAGKLQEALAHWKQIAAQAGEGITLAQGMRLLAGAGANLDAAADTEEVRGWSFVTAGKVLRELLQNLRSPEKLAAMKPGKELEAELRHYQEAGVSWLWLLSEMGLGACLADDMGLGKTIQIIALLLLQKKAQGSQAKKRKPSLLVVPASLLGNWKSEIEKFAPTLKCAFLHRSLLNKNEFDALERKPDERLHDMDAVFTTYSMVARIGWLQEREWNLCVIDEAQAIKNPTAQQAKTVKKIRSRARIALTGTPVENRLSDLWSLFDFINPGLLGSSGVFKNFVSGLEKRKDAPYAPLRNLVRPYILRRLKTDRSVISDLPDKTEVKAFCHLTTKQAALYRQNVKELSTQLEVVQGIHRRGLVLSYLMRFKQICNHPSQLTGDSLFHPTESGKFDRLREICEEIASRQEKALVFTQYKEMTGPLAELLSDIFGRAGLVLHGGTAIPERQKMVKQFQGEDGPPFFVLSLKAGGTGLNLTAASHVIHFDRWWNPAVENQATDRAFRIGQKKNVLVHKFVCPGTLEERIDELISEKSHLAGEILEEGGEIKLTEMSNDEILRLVSLDVERASV